MGNLCLCCFKRRQIFATELPKNVTYTLPRTRHRVPSYHAVGPSKKSDGPQKSPTRTSPKRKSPTRTSPARTSPTRTSPTHTSPTRTSPTLTSSMRKVTSPTKTMSSKDPLRHKTRTRHRNASTSPILNYEPPKHLLVPSYSEDSDDFLSPAVTIIPLTPAPSIDPFYLDTPQQVPSHLDTPQQNPTLLRRLSLPIPTILVTPQDSDRDSPDWSPDWNPTFRGHRRASSLPPEMTWRASDEKKGLTLTEKLVAIEAASLVFGSIKKKQDKRRKASKHKRTHSR